MGAEVVVITGSTRGIGFGLAEAFLALGCRVVISGRNEANLQNAFAELRQRHGAERLLAFPCDVRIFEQVQALWQAAREHFGGVDIWVNNAGLSQARLDFWEHSPLTFEEVVSTNLLGVMYGCRVALAGMLAQGYGAIYNMEGLGSDGRIVPKLGVYGATKAALRYLDASLAKEVAGLPVLVGGLRPGMVLTEMLLGVQARRSPDWQKNRRLFYILGSHVEEVAPWLAKRMLANRRNGVCISYLTLWKMLGRLMRLLWQGGAIKLEDLDST